MQEVFVETLVAKKPTKKDALLRGAVVVGMLVLGAPSYIIASFNLYFTVIGAVVCAGLLYCIYYFWTALNLEFEYILTGSEMDVDRISAHRSCKHLLTVDGISPVWKGIESPFFTALIPRRGPGTSSPKRGRWWSSPPMPSFWRGCGSACPARWSTKCSSRGGIYSNACGNRY